MYCIIPRCSINFKVNKIMKALHRCIIIKFLTMKVVNGSNDKFYTVCIFSYCLKREKMTKNLKEKGLIIGTITRIGRWCHQRSRGLKALESLLFCLLPGNHSMTGRLQLPSQQQKTTNYHFM